MSYHSILHLLKIVSPVSARLRPGDHTRITISNQHNEPKPWSSSRGISHYNWDRYRPLHIRSCIQGRQRTEGTGTVSR